MCHQHVSLLIVEKWRKSLVGNPAVYSLKVLLNTECGHHCPLDVALPPQSDIALLFRCGVSQQKTGKFGQAHCGHQQEGGLYDDKNRKRLQKHRDVLQAGPGV